MRTTLIKYISKEIWSVFLTCLVVFIFIIMATDMVNKTELMVRYGVGLGEFFNLIRCLFPRIILFAMPAACLMAVLLSFIRMSSDNEIIALHSSGVSLYQLMPPVIIFSFICFLFAGTLTFFGVPYGNRMYNDVSLDIKENLKNRADSLIKEGVFNEQDDFVFYVENYSRKDRTMEHVFIVDKSDGKDITITAAKGRFKKSPNGTNIQLIDGESFAYVDGSLVHKKFSSINYSIFNDLLISPAHDKRESEEMYFGELLEFINNAKKDMRSKNIAELQMYEMFSIPMAILLMGLTGAPLGAHIKAQGRTKGIIISLALFLSYYIILMSVRYMCENGTIISAVGVWVPVLFLLIIFTLLLTFSAGSISFGKLNRFRFSN